MSYSWKYLNVDIIGCFFSTAAMCYLVLVRPDRGLLKTAVAPGILCGFAIASKYPLGLVLLPFILYYTLKLGTGAFRTIALLVLTAAVSFLLVTPYFIIEPHSYVEAIVAEINHYKRGHRGYTADPGLSQLAYYNSHLMKEFGLPAYLLGLAGIGYGLKLRSRFLPLILSFPVGLLFYMSMQRTHFIRNILPVYVWYALLIALGFTAVYEVSVRLVGYFGRSRWKGPPGKKAGLAVTAILMFLILPTGKLVKSHTIQSESRHEASDWVTENVPYGSRLVIAGRLRMNLYDLTRHYAVEVFPFERIEDWGEVLSSHPEWEEAYFLVPTYGHDRRFPKRKTLADSLNESFEGLFILKEFGSRDVYVKSFQGFTRPNPRFSVRRLPPDRTRSEN